MVKWYLKEANSQILNVGYSTGKLILFLQYVKWHEKKKRGPVWIKGGLRRSNQI